MCQIHSQEENHTLEQMAKSDFDKIVQKLFPTLMEVHPTNIGEPLISPWFDYLAEKAYEYGVLLDITSNGTLLTEEKIKKILPSLLDIKISFDGAKKETFEKFLATVPMATIIEGKIIGSTEARIVFSTYQSMLSMIKDTSTCPYGIGHFDLIIVDEAHRSLFNKFAEIFDYFDALMIGLTATPRNDIHKSTYKVFDLDNEEPNYEYLSSLFRDVITNHLKEEIDYKYDWLKNDIDLNKNIKENYITEEGFIDNDNDLNNSSMINNLSNSFSNSRGNSFSGNKDFAFNDNNNLDTLHYDENADDIVIKKDVIKEEENEDMEFGSTKKKNGICCQIY